LYVTDGSESLMDLGLSAKRLVWFASHLSIERQLCLQMLIAKSTLIVYTPQNPFHLQDMEPQKIVTAVFIEATL